MGSSGATTFLKRRENQRTGDSRPSNRGPAAGEAGTGSLPTGAAIY